MLLIDPDTNIKTWLNQKLENTQDPLETSTELLSQLQIQSSQLSFSLQTEIQSTLKKLPLLERNINECQASLVKLKMRAHDRLEASDSVPLTQDTNPSNPNYKDSNVNFFQTLLQLDQILERMKDTHSWLKEAENWNSLTMEMEAIFDSKDFVKAAARLDVSCYT